MQIKAPTMKSSHEFLRHFGSLLQTYIEMDEHRREMYFKCLWCFLVRGVLTVYLNLVTHLNVAFEYK